MAGGRSSTEVCRELGLPRQTVGEWRSAHSEFRRAYIEAFAARCYGFGEEALEILDAVPPGADMAAVTLARAKADKRLWIAARLVPAFADQVEHRLSGSATIQVQLPSKHDRAPLIEGVAQELVEEAT
jgi:hypothetical protein